eukprot:3538694-Rhodomonas_salina.1
MPPPGASEAARLECCARQPQQDQHETAGLPHFMKKDAGVNGDDAVIYGCNAGVSCGNAAICEVLHDA